MAMSLKETNQYFTGTIRAGQQTLYYESGLALSSEEPEEVLTVSEEVTSALESALSALSSNIARALLTLREIVLLSSLQEGWKGKLNVDLESLLETSIPHKELILGYLLRILPEWLDKPEVREIKITAGTPEGGLNPHIVIIAKFKDSEEAVDMSEDFEYQLLSADPKVSNRILVYSLFE
ncbi:hypothetical protein TEU_02280 [Thermococcus eurythermalis]|uniref:Uncharacterized protein n=1 Tax=Thermococcus eurythermalis TaxID=1505907 RepID=A0A097QS02_9EURY|nr:hypothetical protein [Thermococcus eurythermalis]AIU69261.1 hypothetical protein TEU_02280 [Thermococcus eurythermalis]